MFNLQNPKVSPVNCKLYLDGYVKLFIILFCPDQPGPSIAAYATGVLLGLIIIVGGWYGLSFMISLIEMDAMCYDY